MTHTTRFKFNVNDIVTIASDYKEFAKLDIAQPQIQVYSVMSVNADGTITLAGVFSDIPANYVVGVPKVTWMRMSRVMRIYITVSR